MKKVLGLAAIGLFALSTSAWAECGGHGKVAQTDKPTITLAPGQTASAGTKTTKPDS
jgi:hypothetical protein